MMTYPCANVEKCGSDEVDLKDAEAWVVCPECRLLQRLEPDGDAGDEGQLVDASYMVEVTTDERLAKILGETSSGPSLSVSKGKFIIYRWEGDLLLTRPCVGKGRTLVACIEDYYKRTGGKEVD